MIAHLIETIAQTPLSAEERVRLANAVLSAPAKGPGRPRLAVCKSGLHPMTPENRLVNGGCKACNYAATSERARNHRLELKLKRCGVR